MFDRRSNLPARAIPRDVLVRINKAGVSDVDWYAGRVNAGYGQSADLDELSASATSALLADGRKRRKAQIRRVRTKAMHEMRGFLRRGVRRHPRRAD